MRLTGELRARALLFDMDGTLVDSTAAVHRLWRRWAARHGLDIEELLRVQHGRRTEETVGLYAARGIDVATETARLAAEEAEDLEGIVEVPGAAALLRSLPPAQWGIATSAERILAERRLAAAGLPMPEVLVAAEDVHRGKPDPTCYLLAAEGLGVAPADCLVFEDAPAGIAAGRAAGARVVALTTSLSGAELGTEAWIPDFRGLRIQVADGCVMIRAES
jgi:sugar-phosphatase